MANCKKCDGKGWVDNPAYWNAKAKYHTGWELQYPTRINCRACKGTGFVLESTKDAINEIQVWLNNPNGVKKEDLQKAIDILKRELSD
jgi:RecJ-like exonuclease